MWKVSGINRNVLKTRLNELLKQRLILKHKYLEKIDSSKIKEKIYYGKLYKNRYSKFPPLFKRDYYILNFNEFQEVEYMNKYIDWLIQKNPDFNINSIKDIKYEFQYQDLIQRYYFNNKTNQNKVNFDITNYPHLNNIRNKINELQLTPKNVDFKKLDDLKQIIYFTHYMLRYTTLARELEIAAVKDKILLNLLPIDNYTDQLEKCEKYFLNLGMSNADIIIRCSTECCWLDWLNTNKSFVFLPMVDYEALLYDFFNTAHDLP